MAKTFIDPLSRIHKDAKIGTGVKIGPFCTVGPGVTLGDNCELIANVHLCGNLDIGNNCTFFHGAVAGQPCQDLKHDGKSGAVRIGSNNIIREYVTIHSSNDIRLPVQ